VSHLPHREYLVYPQQCFIVTFQGEEHSLPTTGQHWNIIVESASRGKPRNLERREAKKSTLDGAKGFIKQLLDPEYGKGQWENFVFAKNPDGTLGGCPMFLTAPVYQLIEEYGSELAREQLKNGAEPEIVALCGGLENALVVWAHFQKQPPGKSGN